MPTNHVTSLGLSRRLKELGVLQKSLFIWSYYPHVDNYHSEPEYNPLKEGVEQNGLNISAYLASELGELLPNVIKKTVEWGHPDKLEDWFLSYEPAEEGHKVTYTYYYYEPMDYVTFSGDTEVDARAKCLIYLLENHLISVEELGK